MHFGLAHLGRAHLGPAREGHGHLGLTCVGLGQEGLALEELVGPLSVLLLNFQLLFQALRKEAQQLLPSSPQLLVVCPFPG